MQKSCVYRKGKQRKSSVSRGARNKLTKKSKRTAVAGNQTLHHLHIRSIYSWQKPMFGHTDSDSVGNCHIRIRLYGVSLYVRFWPTLHKAYTVRFSSKKKEGHLGRFKPYHTCTVCMRCLWQGNHKNM